MRKEHTTPYIEDTMNDTLKVKENRSIEEIETIQARIEEMMDLLRPQESNQEGLAYDHLKTLYGELDDDKREVATDLARKEAQAAVVSFLGSLQRISKRHGFPVSFIIDSEELSRAVDALA